jgi:Uma2 family endonuclease
MATTRATTLYTADELFQMGDDARFELIEGELVEMPPPFFSHGKTSGELFSEFRAFILQHRLPLGYTVEAGYLFARDPDTVLAPDVSIISAADLPLAEQETGYPPIVPLLAVEVVSQSNRPAEIQRKVEIYLAAGVQLVWIVDKRQRTVIVHRADGTVATLRQGEGDEIDGEVVLPGFRLRLAELFGD